MGASSGSKFLIVDREVWSYGGMNARVQKIRFTFCEGKKYIQPNTYYTLNRSRGLSKASFGSRTYSLWREAERWLFYEKEPTKKKISILEPRAVMESSQAGKDIWQSNSFRKKTNNDLI